MEEQSAGTAGWLSSAIGAVGSIGTAALSGNQQPQVTNIYQDKPSSNKTAYYVVGAVVIVVVVYLFVRNRK